jgi:ribonuclease P protein component
VKRKFRLTRSTDFKRVRRNGKSYAHPLVVLVASPEEHYQQVRIGVVAGRSIGCAVARNRAKRRLRACLAGLMDKISPGYDLIFLARKPLDQASFTEICEAVRVVLRRAGVLND